MSATIPSGHPAVPARPAPAPPPVDLALIDAVRAASRRMVRALGFMRPTLADTPYSPSAVHALLEIGAGPALAASELAARLDLDKSSVSRMLRRLSDAGEIEERADPQDGRVKQLALTRRGRRTRAAIEAYARGRVTHALAQMVPAQRERLSLALDAYARGLDAAGATVVREDTVVLRTGYHPGVVGRIAELHGVYYAQHQGMGQFFESRVAAGAAEFAARAARPGNGLWTAMHAGCMVGAIAIDGEDLGDGRAHLRWFIVDDAVRGLGVGRRLLEAALASCDAHGHAETHLWTYAGLDAARHLYESHGFHLAESWQGEQWGRRLQEQRFMRPRPR